MKRDLVLAIDVGITNAKATLFNAAGIVVASASRPYPTVRSDDGRVEQSPGDWWMAVQSTVRSLWQTDSQHRDHVAVISVTGQMHALVVLDRDGVPMGPSLVLGDRRAWREAQALSTALGEGHLYAVSGARLDASMPAAKVRWLFNDQPDLRKRVRTVTGCKDYLRHLLTGDLLTDPIDACATSLYDIDRATWSEEMLDRVGLQLDQLPVVQASESHAGTLRTDAAAQLGGLLAGLPVVVGAGDDVEVLGHGSLKPGDASEHIGTTGSILVVAQRGAVDPSMSLERYPHVIPGLRVVGGSITAAGSALAWAAQLLGYPSVGDALVAAEGALTSKTDHVPVFVPHLAGERVPNRRLQARGEWVGISLSTTRAELMLAVCEGVTFALNSVLQHIDGVADAPTTVRASGWLEQPWLQFRSDTYGRRLEITDCPSPTALGATILASVCAGWYSDVATAMRALVRHRPGAEPRPLTPDGAERFARFMELSDNFGEVWSKVFADSPAEQPTVPAHN